MDKIKVRNGIVKIGDYVEFKSDIEQCGKVIDIKGSELKLENKNGFDGDYIRYETITYMRSRDCWAIKESEAE
jgi:hypothetical protein